MSAAAPPTMSRFWFCSCVLRRTNSASSSAASTHMATLQPSGASRGRIPHIREQVFVYANALWLARKQSTIPSACSWCSWGGWLVTMLFGKRFITTRTLKAAALRPAAAAADAGGLGSRLRVKQLRAICRLRLQCSQQHRQNCRFLLSSDIVAASLLGLRLASWGRLGMSLLGETPTPNPLFGCVLGGPLPGKVSLKSMCWPTCWVSTPLLGGKPPLCRGA